MNRSTLALIGPLALSTGAMADILSATPLTTASVTHNDVSSNPMAVFQQIQYGPPVSLNSPLTTTTVGTMNYLTEAYETSVVTTSTPNLWQLDNYFAADCEVSGSANNNMTGNARGDMDTQVSFTLDAPGTVTFTCYNTVLQTTVGSAWATAGAGKTLWLDNVVVQASYADSTLSIGVGAGSHTLEVDERAMASFVSGPPSSDYATTYALSRTRVTIQSVPEPLTILGMVLGIALIGRRNRKGY